ncbi:MAG: flippase-like domain-containing protein [Myxococcales bacterium]|nr:flippase-like domain-containing protein [Myxococcales bacterium]
MLRQENTAQAVERKSPSRRRAMILFWFGIFVAVGLLFWSLRGVSAAELKKALSQAQWHWLLTGWGLMWCSMLMRSVRWASLFPASLSLRARDVLAPLLVGALFNLLLPGRLGELVRSVALSKQTQVPASSILATIVVERLVDALLMLLFALVWLFNFQPRFAGSVGLWVLAGGLFTVLLGLVLIWAEIAWVDRLLQAILRILPKKISETIWNLYAHFRKGLRMAAELRQLSRFLGVTLLIWSVELVSLHCLLWTFGLSLNLVQVAFLLGAVALGSALLPAPGQVGTFQFFAIQAAVLLAIPKPAATAFALVWHAAVFSTLGLMGLGALLWLRKRWSVWSWSLVQENGDLAEEKNV